jgi:hypothetical protein
VAEALDFPYWLLVLLRDGRLGVGFRHGHGGCERQLVVSSHPTEQVLDPPPRPQRPQRARPHRLISGTNPSLRPSSPLYSFPSISRSKDLLPQSNSLRLMPSWSAAGRRTARSRSSGWPRRGSSRRARPANSSGRYRIGVSLLWILGLDVR